jgi:hypothetical protein
MAGSMFLIKSDKSVDISVNHVERMSSESLPWQAILHYAIGRPRRRRALYLWNSVAWVHKRNIPTERPPLVGESYLLWSRGQSSLLHIQGSRVRFPALPDFLRSSGPGKGSTQPCEDNWGAISKKWRIRSRKPKIKTVGILWADYATPSIR